MAAIVPVDDPAALARAVGELLGDRSRWRELSAQALRVASRMHPEVQLQTLAGHLLTAYPQLDELYRRR